MNLPDYISRRKVITVHEGIENMEYSLSIACMHCTDAPCQQVCPVDCFYIREDGIVLHDKDKCIGCAYCLYACPFGAPQFPLDGAFGTKGVMDKCTMCAGGPEETNSPEERELYGQNRISEGKVPVCAAMCSTKALLVGDSLLRSQIFTENVYCLPVTEHIQSHMAGQKHTPLKNRISNENEICVSYAASVYVPFWIKGRQQYMGTGPLGSYFRV